MGAPRPLFDATQFVQAMSAGGSAAQAAARGFIRAYKPRLRARCRAQGVAFQDIDDLVGEVLTSVVKSFRTLRDPDRFDGWVFSIAVNVLNQYWTKVGRDREWLADPPRERADGGDLESEPALFSLPDLGQSDPDTALCIERQLDLLRAQHPDRYACLELLVQGFTPNEVSTSLGRNPGATRQFISQCCAVAAKFLEECLEPSDLAGRKRGGAAVR